MTLEDTHKSGRPNLNEQTIMHKKISEYFEKGISAATASRETGHNIKTIYKHYGEISKNIVESQTADLIERKNIETAQLISSYERFILNLHPILDNALDGMAKLTKENKPIPRHIIGDVTRITNLIAEMNDKKYNLSLKIVSIHKSTPEKYENEDDVRNIVRQLLTDPGAGLGNSTKRGIINAIIHDTKCDVSYAEYIFDKMMRLGLEVCTRNDRDDEYGMKYSVVSLAMAREYLSTEESFKYIDESGDAYIKDLEEQEKEEREKEKQEKLFGKFKI